MGLGTCCLKGQASEDQVRASDGLEGVLLIQIYLEFRRVVTAHLDSRCLMFLFFVVLRYFKFMNAQHISIQMVLVSLGKASS